MKNPTTTAASASDRTRCTIGDRPAWCSAEHDGDTDESFGHTTLDSPPIVVTGEDGKPANLCVDIEQNDGDPAPYIVVNGPYVDNADFSAVEAARIGVALLARSVEISGVLPPDVWAELAVIVAKGVR